MSIEVNPTGNATPIEQVRRNGTVNSDNADDFDIAKETGRMYTPDVEISPEAQAAADAKAAETRETRARNHNAAVEEMQALKKVSQEALATIRTSNLPEELLEADTEKAGKTIVLSETGETRTYNEAGHIAEIRDAKGNVTFTGGGRFLQTFAYNDKGQKTEARVYDAWGNLQMITDYEYDEKGNISADKSYDENGNLRFSHSYEYDDNGNPTNMKGYDKDGNLDVMHNYKYDEKGNLLRDEYYDDEGLISTETYSYEFNDQGCLVKTWKIYDEDNKFDRGYKKTYDAQGQEVNTVNFGEDPDIDLE